MATPQPPPDQPVVGVAGVAHKHSLSGAGHPHPGCDDNAALEPSHFRIR